MTPRFSPRIRVIPVIAATTLVAFGSSTSSNNPKPAADVRILSSGATKGVQAYSPDTFVVNLAAGSSVLAE